MISIHLETWVIFIKGCETLKGADLYFSALQAIWLWFFFLTEYPKRHAACLHGSHGPPRALGWYDTTHSSPGNHTFFWQLSYFRENNLSIHGDFNLAYRMWGYKWSLLLVSHYTRLAIFPYWVIRVAIINVITQ